MLSNLESIELAKELEIDKLYNILKTSSSQINLEIFSKIQSFSTSHDFFSNYAGVDINILLDFLKKLEDNLFVICNNEKYLYFNSNEDKYISICSNLILLFNFILRTRKIFKSIINRIKNNIIKYFSENVIDSELNDKINDNINKIINLSLTEDKYKNSSFLSFNRENISTTNNTTTTINSIIKDKVNIEESNKSILYDNTCEENIITPYFVSNGESFINNIEIVNNNNSNINFFICKKSESIDYLFNLPCNNLSQDINNSLKENKSKTDNIQNNDKSKILNKINLNKNSKEEGKNNNKSKNLSNANIYKVLLKNIKELYKKRNITSPQKVKLKRLIISKSPKLENVYYSYYNNNNKNKFIEDLKKLL